MPTNRRDVIVLDEDDDTSSPRLITPRSAYLLSFNNSRVKQYQRDQQTIHSNIRHHSFASLQSASQGPSIEIPAQQASDNLPEGSSAAHTIRGFICSDTKQPPQMLPQTSNKETSKRYSQTNNINSPYFTDPSWSSTAPVTSIPEAETTFKPVSASLESFGLGGRDLASADMTPTEPSPSFLRPMRAELTDDDGSADDEDLALWMAQDAEDEMRRLSVAGSDTKATSSRRSSILSPRNLPIISPLVQLDNFTYKGIPLAEKVYVELEDKDFLRIVHIIQDTSTSAVTLRGWRFRRTRELNGVIDRKLNEVCWILHVDEDDPRDVKLQGMETVPVCNIVKRRRIRLTNQSFPALSWREDEKKESPETVENDRVLVCRFKYLCFYANAKARAAYAWHEKGFHRLREDECDQRPDNSIKDEELRETWRGYTAPGGSQEGWLAGEKEFLRQETVSHRGVPSLASLKAPSGPDFPIGDPMKRGNVGFLVTQVDLHTRSGNDTGEVPVSSTSRPREHRQNEQKPHRGFLDFNDPFVSSSDCDTHGADDTSALRRGLGQSSIQPRESRARSPRIVEIDAHVKTFLSLGTLEKRYEGKVTSRYYPAPSLAQSKRKTDISLDSPTRPSKRIHRELRAQSSKADLRKRYDNQNSRTLLTDVRYSHQESASSDSDRTLGRSRSPDSVEEMCTPSKLAGYKTSISGLLSPVSRRKGSASRRSSNTMLASTMGDFTEYLQTSSPVSMAARSSVINMTQAYGITENDNGIVDLTKPQVNPYGSLSRASSSKFRPTVTSDPSYIRPVLSLKDESSRPTSAHSVFKSKHSLVPTELPRDFNSTSSNFQPITPGSSRINGLSSRPSSSATLGPSSRRIQKPGQQNHNTAFRSLASKAYQKRYTFGDCFCGAGGMSRGAVSAGLRINWGFDFNLPACQSYQMNFFGTSIYNVWANQFSQAEGYHKVDICHLSPPCQFFSDAHTVQGKDDDMNTASLFAIFNLLEKAKPRIVTLEQTSGLIRRHPIFFNAVINMFTSRGFSIRWKVMNCADFGLPQRRTRLFVMASCPGEVLPPFPKPTHSSNPEKTGLKPWTTINETIATIPHGWPNHDIHMAIARDHSPQSGDKIATCVTTSGGGIIHPSGKRDYTHREFACLQSFPLGHKFAGTGVKKQIGNAVPPAMAKILLETVKDALLRADGLL